MKHWMNKRVFATVAFLLVMLGQPVDPLQAHPHEFVDMKVEAHFDAEGRLSGLRYTWLFDEFFSAYAIEGQDANKNGQAEPSELKTLMTEILGNIQPIDYFTKFDQNGVVPELGAATPVSSKLIKRQYELSFDIPFKQPVNVSSKPLRYAVYDDEFYIAMTHNTEDGSVRLANAPKGCQFEMVQPNPDDDVAAFAGSLGKSESGGSDLGKHFAEWVVISCK